jgi:peptide/nickel transport system substrate-binding protein
MTALRGTRTRRIARLIAIPLAAGLIAASCGGDDDSSDGGDDSADAGDDATDAGDDSADAGDDATDAGDDSGDSGIVDDDESDGSPVVETIAPEENTDPVAGGTLRYGLEADVNGINPAASSLSVSGLMMGNAVFDTLAALTPVGEPVPYLAESFSSSDDFRSWQVKLREGITFHDDTPLNAEAVVVNFESQRAHPLVGLAVAPFYPAEGATEIIDDLTVQFNLLDPDAKFPTALTGQLGMMASPTWLAAAAEDGSLNQAPVGTGPFVFDSRSEDSVTRFVRNDDWWNGEVYLDAIEFFPVTDSDNRTDLLFGGELDALHTTNQPSILDIRADDSFKRVEIDASEESFAMMNSSVPPFDDIRAREALTRATPVDLYNELIGLGVNRPAEQMFIPESPFYNPDVVQVHDDPDGAVALVAEYCAERGTDENTVLGTPTCTDGKINIELQWSGPSVVQTRIADILDEAWSVAFNVTFNELLQDEHISQTAFGQYNVNTWRQFGAANPTNDNVWLMCRTIGGISLNWPRFCDEERDALILEAMATPETTDRIPLMQELVRKINEDYLYVFFNHTMWLNAFDESVNGVCDRTSPEGVELVCATNGRTWFDSVWIS